MSRVKEFYDEENLEYIDTEVARFDLTEDYSTSISITAAEIYKHNNEWKFNAIGNGSNETLNDFVNKYVK